MRVNNLIKKSLLAVVALLSSVSMVSCVADSDEAIPGGTGEGGNLYISIKTETMGTRAVTIDANPSSSFENYLGSTLICIFDTEGKLVQNKAVTDLSGVVQHMDQFDGKTYGVNYTVAVASNLGAAAFTRITNAIAAATNEAPFTLTQLRQTQLSLDEALNDDVLNPATPEGRRIPMYGEGLLASDGEGNYYTDVRVQHSLVKVSLNQLVVDFGESSTRNATFKPDQVFLTNVPDVTNVITTSAAELNFTYDADTNPNPNKMYQGDASDTDYSTYPDAATHKVSIKTLGGGDDHANLIGTDVMTGSLLKTLSTANSNWLKADDSANRQYYFYTLPSAQTGNNATYLVVSGMFDATGSGVESRVYYRVKLNGNLGADGTLQANKNYKVNMIIRGKGGVDAYTDGVDPTLVEAFVTTGEFDEVAENAQLGAGDAVYSTFGDLIKVGDILFADGKFKSQSEAKAYKEAGNTPIGIVFHMFNDQETAASNEHPTYNGWHGLVMALKDAHAGIKWADNSAAAGATTHLSLDNTGSAANPSAAEETTVRRAAATRMKSIITQGNNGLANWSDDAVATYKAASGNAFNAVATFDADGAGELTADVTSLGSLTTSGWFLPSIGELYKMTYSLGKLQISLMNTSGTWGSATDRESGGLWTPWGMYYTNGSNSQGVADITRENINRLLSVCDVTTDVNDPAQAVTYTPFEGGLHGQGGTTTAKWQPYWSSSEWSAGYAFSLRFGHDGSLHFARNYAKSGAYRVRAVLAF